MVKRYDRAQTPYQRVLALNLLDNATAQALAKHYRELNPLRLQAAIEQGLERLWALSERPSPVTKGVRQPLSVR